MLGWRSPDHPILHALSDSPFPMPAISMLVWHTRGPRQTRFWSAGVDSRPRRWVLAFRTGSPDGPFPGVTPETKDLSLVTPGLTTLRRSPRFVFVPNSWLCFLSDLRLSVFISGERLFVFLRVNSRPTFFPPFPLFLCVSKVLGFAFRSRCDHARSRRSRGTLRRMRIFTHRRLRRNQRNFPRLAEQRFEFVSVFLSGLCGEWCSGFRKG